MATLQATGNQVLINSQSDGCQPEGAMEIVLSAMTFDGTGTETYNFTTAGLTYKQPSSIRTLYFDARNLTADAILAVTGGNGQQIRIPAGKQGYISFYCPVPLVIAVTSATGSGTVFLILYNFRVPPYQW